MMITGLDTIQLTLLDCDEFDLQQYDVQFTCREDRVEDNLRKCARDFGRTHEGKKFLHSHGHIRWSDFVRMVPRHFLQKYSIMAFEPTPRPEGTLFLDSNEAAVSRDDQ